MRSLGTPPTSENAGRFLAGIQWCRALLAIVSVAALIPSARAETKKIDQIGSWSIFCDRANLKPSIHDCSLHTSVEAKDDPAQWIKLGFVVTTLTGDIELTIRTPKLNYFRKGVSVSTGTEQVGRAFIERCGENWCEARAKLEGHLLKSFAGSPLATLEYPTSESETVALLVPIEGFVEAVGELRTRVGLNALVADSPSTSGEAPAIHLAGASGTEFKVEMRTSPYALLTNSSSPWGETLKQCLGEPATKDVKVTADLKISDAAIFNKWIADTKPCASNSVLWIIRKDDGKQFYTDDTAAELASFAVLGAVRDKSKYKDVVLTDSVNGSPFIPKK